MNQNSINSNSWEGGYGSNPLGPQNNGNPSMTYHYVFIVMCILGALGTLRDGEIFSLLFLATTAFFLYKRTKIGYVLCLVYNGFLIAGGVLFSLLSILFFFSSDLVEEILDVTLEITDYKAVWDWGFNFLAIFFLIVGIACIIWGVLTIIYYRKRKHLFVNSITNQSNITNQIGYGGNSQTTVQSSQSSFCPYCGEPKNSDAKYCPHCGAKS